MKKNLIICLLFIHDFFKNFLNISIYLAIFDINKIIYYIHYMKKQDIINWNFDEEEKDPKQIYEKKKSDIRKEEGNDNMGNNMGKRDLEQFDKIR